MSRKTYIAIATLTIFAFVLLILNVPIWLGMLSVALYVVFGWKWFFPDLTSSEDHDILNS